MSISETNMWFLVRFIAIALCIISNSIQTIFSQDCKLTWENGTDFKDIEYGILLDRILDTAPSGTKLLSAKAINVGNITSTSSNTLSPKQYVKPTLVDGRLILTLTDNFVKYEENEISNRMTVTIDFACLTNTMIKIEFVQLIEDTNNHSPEFMDVPYNFTLPMPLPKNIQLNHFKAISARDVDVTNSNITFHFDPADKNTTGFSVSWLSRDKDDQKRFSATLVTNAVIDFVGDVTFSLFAMDAGKPSKYSKVDIKIIVDRASSILRFGRPLYIANLTHLSPEEAQDGPIKFTEGDIRLEGGDDTTVNYTLRDDLEHYGKNFHLTVADSTISLRLVNPSTELFQQSFVVLSLTARKTGSEGSTILHIALPGRSSVPGSTSTPPSTELPGNRGEKECDNSDYIMVIIILAILLTVTTLCFVVFVVISYRKQNNINQAKNGRKHILPKMGEIRNGSVSSTQALRRSVAFDDNVEEMKTVSL